MPQYHGPHLSMKQKNDQVYQCLNLKVPVTKLSNGTMHYLMQLDLSVPNTGSMNYVVFGWDTNDLCSENGIKK